MLRVLGREIRGALFDMDDLLIEIEAASKLAWLAAIRGASAVLGTDWAEKATIPFLLQFNATNTDGRRRLCLEQFGSEFPFDLIFRARTSSLLECQRELGVTVKPGAKELLRWLQSQEISMAVCTSSDRAEIDVKLGKKPDSPDEAEVAKLGRPGLRGFFNDLIVTGDEIPKGRGKPEPDLFLAGAKLIQVPPENCLVFEDAGNGVDAGQRAGALPIMVPGLIAPTDRDRELTQRLIFSDLHEAKVFLETCVS